MFYLIGTGLTPKQISLEALGFLKKSKFVFLDAYTSIFAEGTLKELEKESGKKIQELQRKEIEENFAQWLDKAKTQNVALLVIGNALTATTHIQLLLDCKEKKVPFKVVEGNSILNSIGKSGLMPYKFGQTVTITFPMPNFNPESFYDKILENKLIGLHSLCLLDIKSEEKKFMTIAEGLQILMDIEKKRGVNNLTESKIVALSALGSEKEKIVAGNAKELTHAKFNVPSAFVVCGKLNEKELEALRVLATGKK